MKKIFGLAVLIALGSMAFAQTSVHLQLNHLLGNEAFALNQKSQNDQGNDFHVTRLEYYISEIEIIHDGGKRTEANDVYILVNASKSETFDLGSYDVNSVEGIRFSIGVDPSVNNADPSQWPSDHPLAPRFPSMHWGWASGYRFVALEGKAGKNMAQNFEVHALGNQNYFTLEIPTGAKTDNDGLIITLNADYTSSISGIDVSSGVITHGDNGEAIQLLKNFNVKVFSALDGTTNVLSAPQISRTALLDVSPNPSNGRIILSADDNDVPEMVSVFDLSGNLVMEKEWVSGDLELNLTTSGIYMIQGVSANRIFDVQKIIVQ